VGMSFDSSLAGSGIIGASINSNVAQTIFSGSGKDLKTLQSALDKEDPHAEGGFLMPGLKIRLETGVEHIRKGDRNVLGYLPGSSQSKEFVVVGAHYDHLGFGE